MFYMTIIRTFQDPVQLIKYSMIVERNRKEEEEGEEEEGKRERERLVSLRFETSVRQSPGFSLTPSSD